MQFDNAKKLVSRSLDRYTISSDHTQVAVIEYSNTARVVAFLNDYMERNGLQDVLDNLQPSRGLNATVGNALELAADHVFVAERGLRLGVPKALVLLTNDRLSDTESYRYAVEKLRKKGVPVYVVVMNKKHDSKEIEDVATSPKHVINTRIPDDVKNLGPKLTHVIDESIEKRLY